MKAGSLLGVMQPIGVAGTLARHLFRGEGSFVGDVYTAGAVLLPSGLLALLAALLDAANVEVILVLSLFAFAYSIIMLYVGCSQIGDISEARAAPAVPIILLASAWITKIIVVAV